jgi:hypothetical protein
MSKSDIFWIAFIIIIVVALLFAINSAIISGIATSNRVEAFCENNNLGDPIVFQGVRKLIEACISPDGEITIIGER